jgi:hypothetical protein
LVSKTQLLLEGKAEELRRRGAHDVREHFSATINAAIGQKMRILKS